MNEVIKIINEEISSMTKSKNKEIFDYRGLIENSWRDVKKNAQRFQRISFDFENDDSTSVKKTFLVKKKLKNGREIKHRLNAEMYEAGGDWEIPVLYFRIEFSGNYGIIRNSDEIKEMTPEYV